MGDRDDKLRGRARLASDLATVDLHGEKKAEPSPSSAFDRPADRFETVGEIGRGGMGRVDDAFDRTLGRPVAIKHMLAQSGLDFARFEREARITARLEHPGIVPVHEAGRSIDGTPYYVMRRVDGQPLAQLVVDKPLEERLKLIPNLLAACDAAGYAHARGIVHRDIKPTNILVGPFGETLLIDWGLARALDEADQAEIATSPSDQNLTRAGTVAGTPGFMAPEQARAETVDARADVFALGATLFFVLSGQLPWGSTSATELVTLVGAGHEPDWKRLPSQVPADLRAVLEKAMAIDPALRYPDAGALAADLRRFTLGNLVAAYEYGPIAKLVLYARKHRAAFGVGLVALAVIALVAVISIRRIVAERDGAEEARSLAEARQRDATAMADELLVQHARELAETDPAAAIAALRRLRPESNRWNDAWAAAVMAWQRGVPFGFAATTSDNAGLAQISISPDNRHVLLANHRRGDLSLFDIVARTRRELAHGLGSLSGVVWLDEHRIACVLVEEQAIGFVDVASGAITRKSHSVKTLYGVGNGRIWVELDNHTVLEYTDPAQPPRALMDHVDDIFVASDLRSAVVRRGTSIEAWADGVVTPLPLHRSLWSAVIRGGMVATVDAEEVSAWKLEQGRAVEYGHWPRDKVAHVRVIDGMPVVITPGGVHALTPTGVLELEREVPEMMWDSSQGMLFAMHDGRLIVYDGDGRVELGKRPTALLRMAQSQDQRWLVALAITGDLLVWDLARVRPRRVHIGRLEQPLLLYRGKVWLSEVGFGARTVDLATGKSEQLLDDVPPADWTHAANHGELIALANFRIGRVAIYDAVRKRSFTLAGIVSGAQYNQGLLFAAKDGQLLRWRTGEAKLLPVMKLPVAPDLLAAAGSNVLARLGEKELAHIDADTQRITRITMPRPITSFAVDLRGDSWLVSGGRLYQWHVGSAPTEIETPGLADDIVPIRGGLAVHCPTAVVIIRGKEHRVIALASRTISRGSFENALVFETPHMEVGVLDLESGSSVLFPQPKPLGGTIAGDETQVVYRENSQSADDAALLVWTLDVPRDPVALRAWLGSITNAKSFPNNDTVVYP